MTTDVWTPCFHEPKLLVFEFGEIVEGELPLFVRQDGMTLSISLRRPVHADLRRKHVYPHFAFRPHFHATWFADCDEELRGLLIERLDGLSPMIQCRDAGSDPRIRAFVHTPGRMSDTAVSRAKQLAVGEDLGLLIFNGWREGEVWYSQCARHDYFRATTDFVVTDPQPLDVPKWDSQVEYVAKPVTIKEFVRLCRG